MQKSKLLKKGERLDDLELNNLMIIQNPSEYLFTSDSVALANFAKCKKNDVVVELCSGSGVIGILLNEKCHPKIVHMVELQTILADMCKRSIEYNDLQDSIVLHNRRLQGVEQELGYNIADVVVVNPPYKNSNNKIGEKASINIAKHEIEVTLEEVVSTSAKLLKFGGTLFMVNKTERLTDIICTMRQYNIEPKIIKFLSNSVLVSGVSGGKSGVKVIKE